MLKTTAHLDSSAPTHVASRLPALYRKFGPLIYSRCRRTLGDEAMALKATEEVFVRVLRSLEAPAVCGAVDALSSACENVCREFRAA